MDDLGEMGMTTTISTAQLTLRNGAWRERVGQRLLNWEKIIRVIDMFCRTVMIWVAGVVEPRVWGIWLAGFVSLLKAEDE